MPGNGSTGRFSVRDSKPKEVEKQNAGVAQVKQFGLIIIGEAYGRANNGKPAPKSDIACPARRTRSCGRRPVTSFYYHNRVLVLPPDMLQNDPLGEKVCPHRRPKYRRVACPIEGPAHPPRVEIRNKDTANEMLRARRRRAGYSERVSPGRVRVGEKRPLPFEAKTRRGGRAHRGHQRPILPSIDDLRKAKVSVSTWSIHHHNFNTLIADTVGRHYFKALADKKVGVSRDSVREQDHGTAKIAYAGSKPLTNVVVVARATMRPGGPKAEATQRWVNFFNESFGPDADANKDAAQLLKATHVLHETEQAAILHPAARTGRRSGRRHVRARVLLGCHGSQGIDLLRLRHAAR